MPAAQSAIIARKKRQARALKLEAKAEAEQRLIEGWFEKYDVTRTGKFNRVEVKALLTEVKRNALNDPAAEVREELLEKICTWYDKSKDGNIERSELLPAVKKYKALLKHDEKLHALFEKHDKSKDSVLHRGELLELLKEVAQDMPHKYADEADLDFVITRVDAEGDGNITFDELGPAIATWKEVARSTPPDEPKSSACTLL